MTPKTSILRLSVLFALALALAGCASSPASRIDKNRALFNSYPADVQQKITSGDVGVGFTPEQVRLALGEPDRTYTRTTDKGTSEVWAYRDQGPSFSFGIGVGGGGGNTRVGTGLGVTTGGDRAEDKVRVIFEGAAVTAVERAGKR